MEETFRYRYGFKYGILPNNVVCVWKVLEFQRREFRIMETNRNTDIGNCLKGDAKLLFEEQQDQEEQEKTQTISNANPVTSNDPCYQRSQGSSEPSAGKTRNVFLGVLFVWILFISSFLGVTFFHPFLFPFMLVGRVSLYRRAVDQLVASWFIYCQVKGIYMY